MCWYADECACHDGSLGYLAACLALITPLRSHHLLQRYVFGMVHSHQNLNMGFQNVMAKWNAIVSYRRTVKRTVTHDSPHKLRRKKSLSWFSTHMRFVTCCLLDRRLALEYVSLLTGGTVGSIPPLGCGVVMAVGRIRGNCRPGNGELLEETSRAGPCRCPLRSPWPWDTEAEGEGEAGGEEPPSSSSTGRFWSR